MPPRRQHLIMELRSSALLPLSEMGEAFEAAMGLIGDDEPTKGEILRQWNEAIEELSRDFTAAGRDPPAAGGGDAEWGQRVADCMNDPPVRDALRAALETTTAYRIAQMAFVGGVPERFVREFLRRAFAELTDR